MSRLTQAADTLSSWPGLLARVRGHFTALSAAHATQARLSQLTEADSRDTRLSSEEILGAGTFDPALPFFYRSGFDRH